MTVDRESDGSCRKLCGLVCVQVCVGKKMNRDKEGTTRGREKKVAFFIHLDDYNTYLLDWTHLHNRQTTDI
jgi:hypothetical protein